MSSNGVIVIHSSILDFSILLEMKDKSTLHDGSSILEIASANSTSILGRVLTPTATTASSLEIIFLASSLYSVVLDGATSYLFKLEISLANGYNITLSAFSTSHVNTTLSDSTI